jgi:hypothetical protein
MRLCKDCKHFGHVVEFHSYKCSVIEEVCLLTRNEEYNPITGEDISEYQWAFAVRRDGSKCGGDGKWFDTATGDDRKARRAAYLRVLMRWPPFVGVSVGFLIVAIGALVIW